MMKCKICKIEINENSKFCTKCYEKNHCDRCKKPFIKYDAHMKLHKAKETGNCLTDMFNVLTSSGTQECRTCEKAVEDTNYYFSIKKCKDCHKEYKKQLVNCAKCNKQFKRSSFYKHKCK